MYNGKPVPRSCMHEQECNTHKHTSACNSSTGPGASSSSDVSNAAGRQVSNSLNPPIHCGIVSSKNSARSCALREWYTYTRKKVFRTQTICKNALGQLRASIAILSREPLCQVSLSVHGPQQSRVCRAPKVAVQSCRVRI